MPKPFNTGVWIGIYSILVYNNMTDKEKAEVAQALDKQTKRVWKFLGIDDIVNKIHKD